ncbi:hypothetical protein SDC9_103622 [bioreactor metagenome]|uniref:Uncharacterized protein n=1 Tax=bioreactor metagenome TaxID=1076179 RepID=A0A645AUM9_9ZZZZ
MSCYKQIPVIIATHAVHTKVFKGVKLLFVYRHIVGTYIVPPYLPLDGLIYVQGFPVGAHLYPVGCTNPFLYQNNRIGSGNHPQIPGEIPPVGVTCIDHLGYRRNSQVVGLVHIAAMGINLNHNQCLFFNSKYVMSRVISNIHADCPVKTDSVTNRSLWQCYK